LNIAIAGGLYGFIDTYVGNVREEDDAWNKFAGGCAAGFFLGMRGTFLVSYSRMRSCQVAHSPIFF
jgi:hypothetical protein